MSTFSYKISSAFLILSLLVLTGCTSTPTATDSDQSPLKIGWSIWVGWMPWAIVEEKGLLEKHNANAELVFFPNYLDSQTAFASGQLDFTHLTIGDSLVPISNGTAAKAIFVNDVSNGGDGLIARDPINSVSDLVGETVSLEFGSVSHFLLLKALETHNVDADTVVINNMPGDLAGAAFVGNKTVKAIATWNPFLASAKEAGGNLLFDSSEIYGLISDITLVQEHTLQTRREDVDAVAAAWFEAMEYIRNPETREEAIVLMARRANTTPEEFELLMQYTDMFLTPERTIELFGSDGKGPITGYARDVATFLLDNEFITTDVDETIIFDPSIAQSYITRSK